ncbi:MAG: cysteine--tRNA ligase [Ruminococcaceae bacterium]|nr:cysteine--tRNA ligase [Oscillospiraceae bacterium]
MKLYNTLTGKKEEFKPIEENKVKIYSCGPTVYNYFHIGNARPFIIFDTLRRYLEYRGYEVSFVQNFTDIDDKMIKRANEENITVKELADRFIAEYFKDAKGLGIKEATFHPKATENIDAIINLISTLVEKGFAYESDGDVYFDVMKFKEYGKLSHQPLENLEAGARIEVGEKKKNPMDFAVWKAKKEGEPYWESPWSEGRPGWHIECSAMANKYLGKTIDIHSGGQDLVFPHHENEVAQSEAANGCKFANYWLHNGYINVDNRKMSKSLGNFFTVRDVAEKFSYEVIRFFMLSAHYRNPINFSDLLLEQAKSGLTRIYTCIENLEFLKGSLTGDNKDDVKGELENLKARFIEAMDDDINTADAISVIFDIVKFANTNIDNTYSKEIIDQTIDLIKELGNVLGILSKKEDKILDEEVEKLIEERTQAKKDKNFKRADEIRDTLKDMGIILEDTRQGVKWRRSDV